MYQVNQISSRLMVELVVVNAGNVNLRALARLRLQLPSLARGRTEEGVRSGKW